MSQEAFEMDSAKRKRVAPHLAATRLSILSLDGYFSRSSARTIILMPPPATPSARNEG